MTQLSAVRRTPRALSGEAALSGTADLMEGLVAACALVAHADGELAPSERRRIFSILRENPAMSVFSREDVAEAIAAHEANFRYDPELAQQIARERLAPFAGNRRASARVLAACRELISADGIAHPAEYRTLREIREVLAFDDLPSPEPLSPVAAAQR